MTKREVLEKAIKELDPEVLRKCIDICDGHTIFPVESFVKEGMPETTAMLFAEELESDGSPKGTIVGNDGKIKDKLFGIYGLRMLSTIIGVFGLEHNQCLGRGFAARADQATIRKHLDGLREPEECASK